MVKVRDLIPMILQDEYDQVYIYTENDHYKYNEDDIERCPYLDRRIRRIEANRDRDLILRVHKEDKKQMVKRIEDMTYVYKVEMRLPNGAYKTEIIGADNLPDIDKQLKVLLDKHGGRLRLMYMIKEVDNRG